MDTIMLSGIQLRAFHGVFPEEKRDGQLFVVDVELAADLQRPSVTDCLEDTIDYGEAAELLRDVFTAQSYDLLERAAGAVCDALLARWPQLAGVTVTVKKPEVKLCCPLEHSAVRITRERGLLS